MRLRLVTASVLAPVLLLSGLTACSADEPVAAPETIVIGVDLNNASPEDTAYAQAVQLRVQQSNLSGVLGNRRLQVRSMENRGDPQTADRNLATFVGDPTVAAVITAGCDECAVRAARTIDNGRIPTLALTTATEVSNPVADRQFTFRLGPDPADSADVLTRELIRIKASTTTIVYADTLAGRGGDALLRRQLKRVDLRTRPSRVVSPAAIDFGPQVADLPTGATSALVVLAKAQQADRIAADARKAGFPGRILFGAEAAGNLYLPADTRDATDNVVMPFSQILAAEDLVGTTPARAARKQWVQDFTSRYGTYSAAASFGADAVDLIASAVAPAGGDRARIRTILESTQLEGLSGPIRFSAKDHSGLTSQALTLLVARSGRWRVAA